MNVSKKQPAVHESRNRSMHTQRLAAALRPLAVTMIEVPKVHNALATKYIG